MAKFRKKPVVVEAEQYQHGIHTPDGVRPCTGTHGHIQTLEGDMEVSDLDWVITGVKGEKYPCKPDIFAATYEPVDAREGGR